MHFSDIIWLISLALSCGNRFFSSVLWTLNGETGIERPYWLETCALDSVKSGIWLEQLACCGTGTCHGFQSTAWSATTGNKNTCRTWILPVYSSFLIFDINHGDLTHIAVIRVFYLYMQGTRLHHFMNKWQKAESSQLKTWKYLNKLSCIMIKIGEEWFLISRLADHVLLFLLPSLHSCCIPPLFSVVFAFSLVLVPSGSIQSKSAVIFSFSP